MADNATEDTGHPNTGMMPPGMPPGTGPPGGGLPPPPGPFMPLYITILIDTFMFLIGGMGNIGTIYAFVTDSKVRAKPSDLIILALAIADLYICLVVMPLDIVEKALGFWFLGEVGCRIKFILEPACITAAINFIVILSWDRYLLLVKEYADYMKTQTQKMIIMQIIVSVAYAFVPGIAENATWNYLNNLPVPVGGMPKPDYDFMCVPPSARSPKYQLIFLILLRFIPIGLVLIFGILFLIRLRRHLLQWKRVGHNVMVLVAGASSTTGPNDGVASHATNKSNKTAGNAAPIINTINAQYGDQGMEQANAQNNPQSEIANNTLKVDNIAKPPNPAIMQNNGNATENATKPVDKEAGVLRKRYVKPAITYAVLILALIVCTTPSHIYMMSALFSCPTCFQPIVAESFKLLVFFNSCLNPILYALTNKKIMLVYKNRLRRVLASKPCC